MSLFDHGCDLCSDDLAVWDSWPSGCPVCGKTDPREEPEPRVRSVVRQSDDWPTPTARPRRADTAPPEDDRRAS